MICPNCNATDHESGAKYCHKCGSPLSYNNDSSRECPKPQDHYSPSSAPYVVETVDLGLPSGTKWANMNVGATKPEEFGGYFAWGEVLKKTTYTWQTYTHCDGTIESCRDIGSNICGTQYDVAHVKWGGKWQMPAYDQFKELVDFCTYEWTNLHGIPGGKFTGPNGKSIFFPAAGLRHDSCFGCRVNDGRYWSGTIGRDFSETACALNFDSNGADCSSGWGSIWSNRYLGQSVRPVLNT